MSTGDHTWMRIAERVVKDATISELQELDDLLKKYLTAAPRIKVIASWWRRFIRKEIDHRGALLFETVKEKIKAKED